MRKKSTNLKRMFNYRLNCMLLLMGLTSQGFAQVNCVNPTSLTASGVTTTSATISYTAPVTPPADGYDYYSGTSNAAPAAATVPTGNVPGTTISLTGNFSVSPRYVWVRARCSSTDQSVWTGPVYLGYCVPVGMDVGIYIESFSTSGAVSNISNPNSGFAAGGYQDANGMVASQAQGGMVSVNATFASPSAMAVWVDWNDNLIFDNATERMFEAPSGNSATGTFTVPATAVPGNHRMRVLADFATAASPCSMEYDYGEAEDYTLNVTQSTTCMGTPASVSISPAAAAGCTSYTGTLTAVPSPAGTGYSYVWQSAVAGSGAWSGIAGATSTSYNATNITSNTDFRCIVSCSGNGTTSEVRTVTIGIPPNDDYCNAIALQLDGTSDCRSTTCATANNDPAFSTYMLSNTTWYKYTPATTGAAFLKFKRPAGSSSGLLNGYAGMYTATGNCPGTLTFTQTTTYATVDLSSADSIITSTGSLTAGTTYYFLIGHLTSFNGTPGGYCIQLLSPSSLTSNDEATGAITLAVGTGCSGEPYTNTYASQSASEPYPSCRGASGFAGMWYKFVAPASGAVKVSCDGGGTMTDSKMALFSAGNVNDYSTFQILACDDNNGVTLSSRSLFYATGLTSGQTYYVNVDLGVANSTKGSYCVTIDSLSTSMLATGAADCVNSQSLLTLNGTYRGWLSLVDATGNLNANIRQVQGSATGFQHRRTIKTGTAREDDNGLAYMNRNFLITANNVTSADVQFFFTDAELNNLGAQLSGLNVTRVSGTTCSADFVDGSGTNSLLPQTANGSANGVHYIQVNTPGFSNFYIMNGTTPLPVELLYFTGSSCKGSNILKWKTANENSIIGFELQRSADGVKFSVLAQQLAKRKDNSGYSFEDRQAAKGINYYRLALAGKDGKAKYSEIVAINNAADKDSPFSIYPNPAKNLLSIETEANAFYSIYDLQGKVVMKGNLQSGKNTLNVSRLAKGFYTIKIGDYNQKIVLQ